jgi:uncharacterized protein YbaP (TraB family)
MLRSYLTPILLVLIHVSSSLNAQQLLTRNAESINSALWKIEGQGITEASYIVATMHLLCADGYTLPAKISRALESVDSLCLEMNITDVDELTYVQQHSMANPKLSETLSDEQIAELKLLLPEKTGMTFEQLEIFTLATIASLATREALTCKSPLSIETELVTLAEDWEKPIIGLESAKEQVEMLSELITAEQLIESLNQSDLNQKSLNHGTKLYLEEKITAASNALMATADMTPAEKDLLIYDRNKAWVKTMAEQMESSAVLYAVGAGHLVDHKGLIALLKKAGYTLTPVSE